MPEPATLSDLLLAQSERKLSKMREGIVGELERLKLELRLVDDALAKKRKLNPDKLVKQPDAAAGAVPRAIVPMKRQSSGRFEGLTRDELFDCMVEIGAAVKPTEVTRYLLDHMNIAKKVDAVRVGLTRLERDGRLKRREDGAYFVPSSNGHAPRPETEAPLPAGTLDFGSSNPDKTSGD